MAPTVKDSWFAATPKQLATSSSPQPTLKVPSLSSAPGHQDIVRFSISVGNSIRSTYTAKFLIRRIYYSTKRSYGMVRFNLRLYDIYIIYIIV